MEEKTIEKVYTEEVSSFHPGDRILVDGTWPAKILEMRAIDSRVVYDNPNFRTEWIENTRLTICQSYSESLRKGLTGGKWQINNRLVIIGGVGGWLLLSMMSGKFLPALSFKTILAVWTGGLVGAIVGLAYSNLLLFYAIFGNLGHTIISATARLTTENKRLMSERNDRLLRNPNDCTLYIARADLFRSVGDYKRAITDCDKALRLDPASNEARSLRAAILVAQEESVRKRSPNC